MMVRETVGIISIPVLRLMSAFDRYMWSILIAPVGA